ncbi:MAG: orotidine-5'-phosphate decarboxylase [Myxococcales bacterium]|nr:orotidine-5'-phosphate decarboxylase [Myxococcales bacterium]USN50438.1 MAG: orotidine-5'-phosphate decarboxylase [Myxococcales bacterium]
MNNAAKKLIIALDDLNFADCCALVEKTRDFAATYKIGVSLFCAHGPTIVKELKSYGVDIFLDLKLHDIPMQVSKAVEQAIDLEPKFLTLHALGGYTMLKEAAHVACGSKTQLLAVSVLTSMDEEQWRILGFADSVKDGVERLIVMSYEAGVRAFVSSPHEAASLKKLFKNDCIAVCPGVRPADAQHDDQKRIMTPYQAINNGADFLVVGRPITKSADVVMSAGNINAEINKALNEARNQE